MTNIQRGTQVRITASRHGHEYPLGAIVTLDIPFIESEDYDPNGPQFELDSWLGVEPDAPGSVPWWISPDEFEVVLGDGYEYGVICDGDDVNGAGPEDGLHRGPWPEENCRAWIMEGIEDGFRFGAFKLVRRPVGAWEVIE